MSAQPLADARAAVAFMTRIPAYDARRPLDAAALSRAATWFPVVGLLVGALMGGVRVLADLGLDRVPATALALLAAIAVTGALHEDGLADAADAVGAHVDRARRLEIMRDSRVGTFGALALVFAVLLPLALLAGLDGEHVLRAALAAHVLARWSTLPQAWLLAPARADGKGALLRVGPAAVGAGTAFAVAVAVLSCGIGPGAAAAGVALLVTGGGALLFARTLGGVTGDTFGAVAKVTEIAVYAALAAAWG